MTELSNRRVTVSEIAHLSGVGVSAVSNWRKRYRDFPAPVEIVPSGDLFDMSSVIEWLELHGRSPSVAVRSIDRSLWAIAEKLRGPLAPEEIVLVILQVLYVRSQADDELRGHVGKRSASAWKELLASDPGRGLEAWARAVERLAAETSELDRVLLLPVGLSSRLLREVVENVSALPLENATLGVITSAFLRRAQSVLAARTGGLATPGSITNLMIELLAPVSGTVYDPAAGHAMVLAEAAQRKVVPQTRLLGQEVLETSWRIGYLHLAMQGIPFDLAPGDTLRDDRFRFLRADRIALESPLGQRFNPQDTFLDERWQFGTTSTAEWMWAQHLLFHLANDGIGVMTAPVGVLSRGGRDAHIRKGIVEADLLDAVIELPPGLIPGTSLAVALLVFQRERTDRSGSVLFIDARQLGLTRRGKSHEFTMDDVERIATTVERWRSGKFADEPLFAAVASTTTIVEGTIDLSPHRFVRYAAPVERADPAEILARMHEITARTQSALDDLDSASDSIGAALEKLHPLADSDWPILKLRDLLEFSPQTGTRQELDGPEETRPWIPTRLVSSGRGRLVNLPDEETQGRTKGRLARRGDLLLASRGINAESRVGCATVDFDGEAAFAESLMLLRPDPARVDPDFLRIALTSRFGRAALAAATTGTVIGNLRRDALEELELRVPDLNIQRRVVDVMRQVEQVVEQLATARDSSRALFDGLRDEIAAGRYGPSAVSG